MNLYLLTQTVNNGYDTYDSCVVAAHDEHEAKSINPGGFYKLGADNEWYFYYSYNDTLKREPDNTWARYEDIKVQLIGVAADSVTGPGVICASFNAG